MDAETEGSYASDAIDEQREENGEECGEERGE
jgi:hypothetical protein